MHLPRVMARFYSNNISVDIAKKSFISNKLRKTQCHFRWVARFALNYCSTLLRAFFRESSYNGIFINATHDIRSVSCSERQRCTLVWRCCVKLEILISAEFRFANCTAQFFSVLMWKNVQFLFKSRFKMEEGTIQEWYFTNANTHSAHPIHIHVNHFQVCEANVNVKIYKIL